MPTVQFEIAADTKTEGDSDSLYTLTVTLTNAVNDETVDVNVLFNQGASSPTATSADINGFTFAELSLGPGNDSDVVNFLITGDNETEPAEDFVFDLEILNQTGGVTIGSPSAFTLTINDNDAPPLPNNALVISEFIPDPAAVNDANGEWVEVFNNTSGDIDLNGYVLRDSGSDSHPIVTSVVVPGGGFAVLCRNGDTETNGGVTCDYQYGSFTLGNGEDEIVLEGPGGVVVDSLQYTGSWYSTGISTVYVGSPNGDNAELGNWAESISREAGFDDGVIGGPNGTPLGDDGSPGTNGVHGNLASPFGVGFSAYCYAQASGDWNDPAMWANCPNGMPGEGEAAAILSPFVVTVSTTASVGVVVVEAGGAGVGNGELSVEGTLNADVVTAAGDLVVASGGALNVGTDLSVSGSLTTNGIVMLLANADNDGRIASYTTEFGSIFGNLTAERTYADNAGGTGAGSFRGIFPPLDGVTFAQLDDDFQTQGAVGSDFPNAQPNLYRFDAPTQQFIPITDFSGTFDPDSGYVFYVFDFDIPATWDVTGTIQEEYTLDLHYSRDGDPSNDFNWVPQPFAGPLDFKELYQLNSSMATDSLNATLYVLDPVTEQFRTYNAESGLGDAGRYVAPFQSFIVQTRGLDAMLEYRYDLKDTGESPLLVGRSEFAGGAGEEVAPHVRLQLEGQGTTQGLGSAQTYLVFYTQGAEGYDPADAGMLYPFSSAYATTVLLDEAGRELSMDARNLDLESETFRVRVATTEPGTYTLSWPVLHEIPVGWSLTLFDTITGEEVDLRAQSGYTFEVTGPTAARRSEALGALRPVQHDGTARFLVTVSATATDGGATGAVPDVFALESAYPNPFATTATIRYALPRATDVRLTVYDVLGRAVTRLVEGPREAGRHTATVSASGLAGGVYFVRMTADGYAETEKIVVLN